MAQANDANNKRKDKLSALLGNEAKSDINNSKDHTDKMTSVAGKTTSDTDKMTSVAGKTTSDTDKMISVPDKMTNDTDKMTNVTAMDKDVADKQKLKDADVVDNVDAAPKIGINLHGITEDKKTKEGISASPQEKRPLTPTHMPWMNLDEDYISSGVSPVQPRRIPHLHKLEK